jgi:hypothetical protein
MAALLPLSALPALLLLGCLVLVLRSLGSLRGVAARGAIGRHAPSARADAEPAGEGPGILSSLVSMLAVGGMVVVGGLGISRGLSSCTEAPAEASAQVELREDLPTGSEQLTVHTTSPLEPGALEVSLSRALGRAVVLAEADLGEGPRRIYRFVLAPEDGVLVALP